MYTFGCDPDDEELPLYAGGHLHVKRKITFSSIVSFLMSLMLIIILSLYLVIKTIICPKYNELDRAVAGNLYEYVDSDFLAVIANSMVADIPEARADLLFDLGLFFKE